MFRARQRAFAVALALASACFALACRNQPAAPNEPTEKPASPQANVAPAPLTTLPAPPSSATSLTAADAGPPPEMPAIRAPLPYDAVARDGAGYALSVALRFPETPVPARGDIPVSNIEAARRKVDPSFSIDLSAQRARIVPHGKGFLLPEGSEIRMRNDFYGGILTTNAGAAYHVLVPGMMRALFNEQRLDVGPLTPAELTNLGEGARRLGYRTRKLEAWTRAAKATFEIARVPDAGEGGVLLCRFLLDWISAPPRTALCTEGEIPLHAEIHWAPRGMLVFDAVSILRRLDMPGANLQTPPSTSRFDPGPLPIERVVLFLGSPDLAVLRPGGETSKLVLYNATEEPRIAWVDGIPLGWLGPGGRAEVSPLPKGKVSVEWRTFLDDADKLPPQTITLPGSSETGGSDAGVL